MKTEKEDEICALCKWSRDVSHKFFCGHLNQKDDELKRKIHYNDTCELFEEKEDRRYLYS